jgi:hypothetical protein
MAARISSAAKDMMVRALASSFGDTVPQACLVIKYRSPHDRRVIVRRPYRLHVAGRRTPVTIMRRVTEYVPAYETVDSALASFDSLPIIRDGRIVLGRCEWSGADLLRGTVVSMKVYGSNGDFFSETDDMTGVVGAYVDQDRTIVLTDVDIAM